MKRLTIITLSLLLCVSSYAKVDSLDIKNGLPEYIQGVEAGTFLDTVKLQGHKTINDYSLIGVNYGVTFCNMYFNPAKNGNRFAFRPNYISVMYTKYCKMFGYIPNFAFMGGIAYGTEGFSFEMSDKGYPKGHVDGATECSFKMIEIPILAQFHFDFSPAKIMINLGVYAGYKFAVERSGPYLEPEYANTFHDYEYRWDYGLQGGLGFALMFDPIEIHFNGMLRWGWKSMYAPNSNPYSEYKEYYYRYANPLDIMVTVGVHYQLEKRTGKTAKMLRQEAYKQVYEQQKIDNEERQSR